MSYSDLNNLISKFYEMIKASPGSFGLSFESAILVLEALLSNAAGSINRQDSYSQYLSSLGFGMFYFDGKFNVDNKSVIALIDRASYKENQIKYEELQQRYTNEFSKMFSDFLEWRKTRS